MGIGPGLRRVLSFAVVVTVFGWGVLLASPNALGQELGLASSSDGVLAASGQSPVHRPVMPVPRPIAIDGSSAASTPAYYAGSVYNGAWRTATSLEVSIRVPHDLTDSGDFYYELLSVWDNNGAYDQIGFSGYYGTWGLTWADLTNCATGLDFSPNAMALSRGVLYTFRMSISSGTVTFSAYVGANQVWTLSRYTGGTAFLVRDSYSCNGQTYRDYTDYEEVYYLTSQQEPSWSFFFQTNKADGTAVSSWSTFYQTNPSDILVYLNGADVTIDNQWFMVLLSYDDYYVYYGTTSVSISGSLTRLYTDYYCFWYGGGYCDVYLGTYAGPSGWSVSFSPSSCHLDYWTSSCSFTMTISIPAGTPVGSYWVGVKAHDWLYRYTTFRLGIQIISGGGGCVARDTPILTPSGYVPVQRLSVGDKVIGYDLITGRLVALNLTSLDRTSEDTFVSINGGELLLTPFDQPIYIKNATFTGWLRNPAELTLGTMIFDAVHGQWVSISGVESVWRNTKVYDVGTDGPNNFVANGYLLDRK